MCTDKINPNSLPLVCMCSLPFTTALLCPKYRTILRMPPDYEQQIQMATRRKQGCWAMTVGIRQKGFSPQRCAIDPTKPTHAPSSIFLETQRWFRRKLRPRHCLLGRSKSKAMCHCGGQSLLEVPTKGSLSRSSLNSKKSVYQWNSPSYLWLGCILVFTFH